MNSKVYTDEEQREVDCTTLLESGTVKRGKEGNEFWRQFGEVRHVYAFLLKDGTRVRLVGQPQSPALFSLSKVMEKPIKA